jgi:anti-anti-sigma regulatory factor
MRAGTNRQEPLNRFLSARRGGYATPEFVVGADVGLPEMVLCRFAGPLNYSNAEYFMHQVLSFLGEPTLSVRWLVLQGDLIDGLDYVAAQMLMELADRIRTTHVSFVLTNVSAEIEQLLRDCGASEVLRGDETINATNVEVAVRQLAQAATAINSGPKY